MEEANAWVLMECIHNLSQIKKYYTSRNRMWKTQPVTKKELESII